MRIRDDKGYLTYGRHSEKKNSLKYRVVKIDAKEARCFPF